MLDNGTPPGLLSDYFGSVDGREGRGIYSTGDNGWKIQASLADGNQNLYALIVFDTLVNLRVAPDVDAPEQYSRGMVFPDLITKDELSEAVDRLTVATVINMTDHLRKLRSAVEERCPSAFQEIIFAPPQQ